MTEWFEKRVRHLYEALLRPAWSWLAVGGFSLITALTWGRDEFASDAYQQRFHILNVLPHWPWQGWAFLSALCLLVTLFEGSFRNVRVPLEKARNTLDQRLQDIGSGRPFTYENCKFEVDAADFNLRKFSLIYKNLGDSILAYKLTAISLRKVGFEKIDITPDDEVHFIHQGQSIANQFTLTLGFRVVPGDVIEIAFIAEYDNVPPVTKRITERMVHYTFSPGSDKIENIIVRRDER